MTRIEAGSLQDLLIADLQIQCVTTITQGGRLYVDSYQEVINQVVLLLSACAVSYSISGWDRMYNIKHHLHRRSGNSVRPLSTVEDGRGSSSAALNRNKGMNVIESLS